MNHLDDIRDTLSHARLCREAWWLFTGEHRDREKIVWAYNFYSDFFGAIHPALYVTFVIKLASLFGERDDEITLRHIPRVEQHASFPELWERGRRLYKYRSKVIAHRDIGLTYRNFARESGFTYDKLKQLLDDTCDLFDSEARRLGIAPVHSFSCESDFLRLMYDLNAQKEKKKDA